MKEKKPIGLAATVCILLLAGGYAVVKLWEYDSRAFAVSAVLLSIAAVLFLIAFYSFGRNNLRFIARLNDTVTVTERESLYHLPAPTVIIEKGGMIVWYNAFFNAQILSGQDVFGLSLDTIVDIDLEQLYIKKSAVISYLEHTYEVTVTQITREDMELATLCFTDITAFVALQKTYENTRPTVLLMLIDNYEDVLQNARESEKATVFVEIEKMLEHFMAPTTGVLRKLSNERFMAVVEEQHLQLMMQNKFKILDDARTIIVGERYSITLSIGVGHGAQTLEESENYAKQALDMALGRGGDQVAVKTENGFKFFGGVSKGVEKKSRTKTRIIANAMQELIHNSDRVFIMGHRFGDLDSIGAALGLAAAIERLGKHADVVVDSDRTLAGVMLKRLEEEHIRLTIDVPHAIAECTEHSLLVVVDTHSKDFMESVDLYQHAKHIVVIDHHRKSVNFIDNAVIFYHEPYASSASELVTELLQHFKGSDTLPPVYAEFLLAGIMLDTKNFIMRTGVRTFEAAALLRKMGADTVSVKQFFASSMLTYQHKTQLVSQAELHHSCAVAVAREAFPDIQLVAPQAADELLGISGVLASFVIFSADGKACISARSMGGMNVQVIMEKLGGGGHQTMAATQIPDVELEQAREMLIQALQEEEA